MAKNKADTAPKPYRLLIAGSRNSSDNALEYARRCVDHAFDNGWQIIVGDNPDGVDAVVVNRCNQLGYTNVIVVTKRDAKTPRNGGVKGGFVEYQGSNWTERDQVMVNVIENGRCIFIWDGMSPGTKAGADYAKKMGRNCTLFEFSTTA